MSAEVGIVVTAHNYGRFLRQCLDSALAQAGTVVAVVDDGSTDDTPAILADYAARHPSRVIPVRCEGVGLAAAANAGVEAMSCPWFIRLDADDWLPEGAVAALAAAQARTGADLVYGDVWLTDAVGRVVGLQRQTDACAPAVMEASPLAAGCLIRRSAWEEAGRYGAGLRFQEDYDFWLRLTEGHRAVHVAEVVYFYRRHGASMSTNRPARAAVRRALRHQAVNRRGRSWRSADLAVVIDLATPADLPVAETLALEPFLGRSLLDRLWDRLAPLAPGRGIFVAASAATIADWAIGRGFTVVEPAQPAPLAAATGAPLVLQASPFHPLIAQERPAELLDALVLHGCFSAITTLPDPVPQMAWGARGLEPVAVANGECVKRVRAAGGMAAFRPEGEDGVTMAEILPPEDMMVFDRASLGWVEAVAQHRGDVA